MSQQPGKTQAVFSGYNAPNEKMSASIDNGGGGNAKARQPSDGSSIKENQDAMLWDMSMDYFAD